MKRQHFIQLHVSENIRVKNPEERLRRYPGAVGPDGTSAAEQRRLFRKSNCEPTIGAVQMIANQLGVSMKVDKNFVDPIPPKQFKPDVEQWSIPDWHQALRNAVS